MPPVARVARRLVPLPVKHRLRNSYLVLSHKRAVLRGYSVPPWSRDGLRYILFDHEATNFTYDIANTGELPQFVAAATGHPVEEIERYLKEILGDESFRRELSERMRARRDRNSTPRFGRRLGWYCVARTCRPTLIVETGTQDGLGTSLLLRAAERNAAEGTPTRVLTLDIEPASGWLIPDRLKERLDVEIGDTRQTLARALDDREVGMFIHDSAHTAENERFEFGLALEHAAPTLVMISDNAHATSALSDLARELAVPYHYFAERPMRHFYPGAAIGLAIYRR